jgi:hypothetical protein
MRWDRVVQATKEVSMSGLLRMIQIVVVVGALVGGGRALWRNREKVREIWESFGGLSGVQNSSGRLLESVGPLSSLVRKLAAIKR